MKKRIAVIGTAIASFATLIGVLHLSRTTTASVNLVWSPSPDSVAGYRVHQRTDNGANVIDVGNTTATTVANLVGQNYFTATAYNAAGGESIPTNEVAVAGAPTPAPVITVNPTSINFTAAGTSKDIVVTTSTGSNWTSADNSPWFDAHPTSGASGTACTLNAKPSANYPPWDITFFSGGLPSKAVRVTMNAPSPTPGFTATPVPIRTPSPTPVKTPTPAPTATVTPPPPSPTVAPSTTPGMLNYTVTVSPTSGTVPTNGGTITYTTTITVTPKP